MVISRLAYLGKLKRLALLAVAFVVPSLLWAAGLTDTQTAVFRSDFASLQWRLNDNDMLQPILTLGSDDRLTLTFDQLAEDRSYLRYQLIHCNSRWQPDQLVSSEFVDGFNEATVDDYAFSEATTVHYVNYRITLPNNQMTPLLSGNYLLRVYDESDPDKTLLQARFSVADPKVDIVGGLSSRTDVDYNEAHQQLSIGIDTHGMLSGGVGSLYNDLFVEIVQNGRQDNVVYLGQPTRLQGDVAWFEHDPRLIFPAGNEYRRMEIVSTLYPGMHVAQIGYAHPYYHAELETDYPRSDLPYSYDQTQHGRFRIHEFNSDDPDIQADYLAVHFSLDMPRQTGGEIYVDGDLFQRRFSPDSRMTFNGATGRYELTALLKQGAYNYQYLYLPYGSNVARTSTIEGDRYQTVNEYLIKVYYRQPGARYDRLVGFATLRSGV